MAFTYLDPGASALEEVRFMIGDTVEKTAFLTDEEILYLLMKSKGDVVDAAVGGAVRILAKLSRLVDETVGSVSKSWSQMRDGYKDLLQDLRRNARSTGGRPFVGGTSRVQNVRPYLNRDTVRPQFNTRMMRNTNRVNGVYPLNYLDDAGAYNSSLPED